MNSKFMKKYLWLIMLAVLPGIMAGCTKKVEPPKTESAFLLPRAVEISDFDLKHDSIGRFDLEQVRGKWSLLFFGYTHCPDVCPTELFMMAEMMRGIEASPPDGIEPPRVVFISVDPERDKLAQLQQYAAFYHASFVGVTGEQATVDRLCQSIGVFYERVYYQDGRPLDPQPSAPVPAELKDSYLINHSASIFLVNPAGRLHAIFTAPHDPRTMIRDLAAIQASWPGT